jgi:hypothetical protein
MAVWEIASGKLRYVLAHPPGLASGFLADDRTTCYTGSTDGTVYRWNLSALLDEAEKTAEPASIDALWQDLASDDTKAAYRAVHGLAAQGHRAVSHLAELLKSGNVPDENLDALIADLDSPRAVVRREASKLLRRAGATAAPKLQQALAANPSPAVRARLEMLFAAPVGSQSHEQIRGVRAVQVLARIGTDEARQALTQLTDGPEGSPLTEAAKSALATSPAGPRK